MGDGDGWADCDLGHRHWGRHGAAGLLLYHPDPEPYVLLQHRARLSSGGGTWGLLGGARHSHEDAVTAALREASEESTLDPSVVRVHGLICEYHGGWAYESVIGSVAERPDVRGASFETAAVRWVHVDEVARLKLFAPFANVWPRHRRALVRPVLVVDAASVIEAAAGGGGLDGPGDESAPAGGGSGGRAAAGGPRDGATAVARLRDRLAALRGIEGLPGTVADVTYPEIVLFADGVAHAVRSVPGVRVVLATGQGASDGAGGRADGGADDGVLAGLLTPGAHDEHRVVVTTGPGLRDRAAAAGAPVVGPRWLLDRLG